MRELLTNFRWYETGELQSMLVEGGRVLERGPDVDDPEARRTNLGGSFLAPLYVDAHCHILPTGLDLQKLHLGGCETHGDVLDRVRQRHSELPEGEWLHAVHYDQTRYPDGAHMDRAQLDAISANRPILLRHVNGHASVANTAALVAAGVGRDALNPKGGEFVRNASGELSGVLLEQAHEKVSNAAPRPTLDQMVDAILAAGEKMRGLGIGCASDMMTGRFDLADELAAYRIAADRGCPVRTRLYMQWATVFGPRAIDAGVLRELGEAMDPLSCRIAGVKIFADGAIGSATAAIYGGFGDDRESRESGQLIYAPDRLKEMVRTAHDAGYSIAIHSIGDRSTDLVMDAYEALGDARHHRIEHAMILSDAQIERMARLGIHCSMQPEFLMRFGHSYKRQLGAERAYRLKRTRSLVDAGVPLSLSSDRPIVAGDPWDGIRTAVRRPEGFDPAEALTPLEALHGYTAMGSVANGEPGLMGTLVPGSLADFQQFESSPASNLVTEAGTRPASPALP